MKLTFEQRCTKLKNMAFTDKTFQDLIQKEIEEHLLDDGVSARAIAEILTTILSHTVWK